MSILKVYIYYNCPFIFFFYSLETQIEICLKYFLDKNPSKTVSVI